MDNLKLLNTLSEFIDFDIKFFSKIDHNKNWIEHTCKSSYDIWLVLDGEICVEDNGIKTILKKGDIYIHFPFKFYTAYSNCESCSFIYIHFYPMIDNKRFALDTFILDKYVNRNYIEEEANSLISTFNEYYENKLLSFMLFKGYFIILLSKILSLQNKNTYKPRNNIVKNDVALLYKVFDYIINHLGEKISIDTLSSIACVSEKYFITYFKKIMGITPAAYISELRLKKSLDYLREGGYSIKEIAFKLGYYDQSAFSKAFKKRYNMPPTKLNK